MSDTLRDSSESETWTKFIWAVNSVNKLAFSNRGFIRSPVFPVDEESKITCCITLSSNENWLEPEVKWSTKNTSLDIVASVKIGVMDSKFREVKKRSAQCFFRRNTASRTFRKFINRESLFEDSSLFFKGDFVLCCEVVLKKLSEGELNYSTRKSVNLTDCNLRKSMASLLEKKDFCDFTIDVKGEAFSCHKFMLACRCEYFSAMFRHSTQENVENMLVLTDIEPGVFKKLLSFIYTGEVDIRKVEDATQLLIASDRFAIERLKILSEVKLNSYLSLENASGIFTLADMYNLQGLKLNAYRVLTNYSENVLDRKYLRIRRFGSKPCLNREVGADEVSAVSQSGSNVAIRTTENPRKNYLPCNQTTTLDTDTNTTNVPLPGVSSYCRTEIQMLEVESWRIKDIKKKGFSSSGHLFSPTFNADKFKWFMQLCADPSCPRCKEGSITVLLTVLWNTRITNVVSAEWKLAVLGDRGQELFKVHRQCDISDMNTYQIFLFSRPSIFLNSKWFVGDDLIFCSTISACESVLSEGTHFSIPKSQLSRNISSLLESKIFVDATIKIQNDLFACHRAILSCNSPFFASLFQQRAKDTVVEIGDIEPNTFKKVLFSLYSGKCDLTLSEILAFFFVDNKYQLFKTSYIFNGDASSGNQFLTWCKTSK